MDATTFVVTVTVVAGGGGGEAEVEAGGCGVAMVVVDGAVGALLDVVTAVLDCSGCHGRQSNPITPASRMAAANPPRATQVGRDRAIGGVDGFAALVEAKLLGRRAACVAAFADTAPCADDSSAKACAKSEQQGNRAAGSLARAIWSTSSRRAQSG